MSESFFEVSKVSLSFDGIKALSNVTFSMKRGEIKGLIGPNGAGKTSLFNVISGLYQPSHGDVRLNQKSLIGLKSHEIVKKGLSRTFQNIRLFGVLSVWENLLLGASYLLRTGFWGAITGNQVWIDDEEEKKDRAYQIAKFLHIHGKLDYPASALSYGEQRRVEIGRSLMSCPQLLCLDEPAAGMNHKETDELREWVLRIRDEKKVSLLVIEHDMGFVMSLCDSIVVLDHGEKIAEGSPREVQDNPKVIEAYLGVDHD